MKHKTRKTNVNHLKLILKNLKSITENIHLKYTSEIAPKSKWFFRIPISFDCNRKSNYLEKSF